MAPRMRAALPPGAVFCCLLAAALAVKSAPLPNPSPASPTSSEQPQAPNIASIPPDPPAPPGVIFTLVPKSPPPGPPTPSPPWTPYEYYWSMAGDYSNPGWNWQGGWTGPVKKSIHNKYLQGTFINCGASAPISFQLNDTVLVWSRDSFAAAGAAVASPFKASSGAGSVGLVGQASDGNLSATSLLSAPAAIAQTARVFGAADAANASYSIPVNSTGYYFVRLYFSNFIYTSRVLCRFSVLLEGAKVLSDFSPNATGGLAMAEFFVPVLDGAVDIQFQASVGDPFINGIAVNMAPQGMYNLTAQSGTLLGAQYLPLRDEVGRMWYWDHAYVSPKDPKLTSVYDYTLNLYNNPTMAFSANTLPDLLPLITFAGGRTTSGEVQGASPWGTAQPYIMYTFAVEPLTPYRVRLGFGNVWGEAPDLFLTNVFIDNKAVAKSVDLFLIKKIDGPVSLDFDVMTNSSGVMTVFVNASESPRNRLQTVFTNNVEVFRTMQAIPQSPPPALVLSTPPPSSPPNSTPSSLWQGFFIGLAVGVVAMALVALLGLFFIQRCLHRRMAAAASAASSAAADGKAGKDGAEYWSLSLRKGFQLGPSETGKLGLYSGGKLHPAHEGKAGDKSLSISHGVPTRTGLYGVRIFALEELKLATNSFERTSLLGQGGFGKVYKAVLKEGYEVAVKRLDVGSQQGVREFMTEVQLLSRLHHKNLVNLIGYCDEDRQLMLVYEYAARGTLKDYLRNESKVGELTWEKRMRIAAGAARGLEYLHYGATPPVIHRDIKASNILLDAHFNAKVADFGLSKLGKKQLHEESPNTGHISTRVKGTLGYLDPVYYTKQQLTEKSDVYSFGVVLLELITGRLPIWLEESGPDYEMGGESIVNLVEWASPFLETGNVAPIAAPTIDISKHHDSLQRAARLAGACVATQPKSRPNMAEVVRAVAEARALMDSANLCVSASGRDLSAEAFSGNGTIREGEEAADYSVDMGDEAQLPLKPPSEDTGSFSVSIISNDVN